MFETECDRILWRGVPPPPPSFSEQGWVGTSRLKQEKYKKKTNEMTTCIPLDVFLLNPGVQANKKRKKRKA